MDTPESIAAEYLRRNATVDIGSAISRGWELVRDNMGVMVGATVLGWVIAIGAGIVPILGWAVGIVLIASIDYMILRRIRGEAIQVGDVFAGFSIAFMQLALCGLIKSVLTSIGMLLCVLPGIYLAVGYVFALPLIIDKKLDFWPAMEVSRRVVHHHWWSVFALAIVAGIVAVAGILACCVGILITIPIANSAFMFTYEDLFGEVKAAAGPGV
jgi:uncharacterized membrane protein